MTPKQQKEFDYIVSKYGNPYSGNKRQNYNIITNIIKNEKLSEYFIYNYILKKFNQHDNAYMITILIFTTQNLNLNFLLTVGLNYLRYDSHLLNSTKISQKNKLLVSLKLKEDHKLQYRNTFIGMYKPDMRKIQFSRLVGAKEFRRLLFIGD